MAITGRAALLLSIVAATASAGAAAAPTASWPLLTFSVQPTAHRGAPPIYGGLCASDLHGHTFRVSDPLADSGEAWSPNGGSIAFLRKGRLTVADAKGRNVREIARMTNGWIEFDWSPDGSELAVASNLSRFGEGSIGISKADGTGRRVLFPPATGEYVDQPAWSPTAAKSSSRRWGLVTTTLRRRT